MLHKYIEAPTLTIFSENKHGVIVIQIVSPSKLGLKVKTV